MDASTYRDRAQIFAFAACRRCSLLPPIGATFVQIFETLFARTYARKRVPSAPAVNSRNARKKGGCVCRCTSLRPLLWFSFSKFSARASNARQSTRGRGWRIEDKGKGERRRRWKQGQARNEKWQEKWKDRWSKKREKGWTRERRGEERDRMWRSNAIRIKRKCFETESVGKNVEIGVSHARWRCVCRITNCKWARGSGHHGGLLAPLSLSLFPLIFIVSRSGCILIFQQAGFIQPLVKLQGTSRPMMFRRFIANRSSLYFARWTIIPNHRSTCNGTTGHR